MALLVGNRRITLPCFILPLQLEPFQEQAATLPFQQLAVGQAADLTPEPSADSLFGKIHGLNSSSCRTARGTQHTALPMAANTV